MENTTSSKQIAANQANAQKSTGPKTPEGRVLRAESGKIALSMDGAHWQPSGREKGMEKGEGRR
jgi:hypothetical protein